MATKIVESEGDKNLDRSGVLLVARLDTAVAELDRKQKEFAAYITELKTREEEIKTLKEKLYEVMTAEGVKKLENDHILVTAVSPSSRKTYDMKALEARDPSLFKKVDEMVGKTTPVKGYAKIKVKEQ